MNIKDEIKELQEAFQSLFEVAKDGEDKKDKKITVNKIKFEREKQGNEPKEVVSVADELFPYEGSAKEQFNQKVIAKINDMIEGTATLEDLINLVRQKKAPVKESLNSIEEAIALMETSLETFTAARKEHNKRLNDLYNKFNDRVGEIFKKHGVEGNTYNTRTPEGKKQAIETEADIKSDDKIAKLDKEITKRSSKSSLYANRARKHRDDPNYLR